MSTYKFLISKNNIAAAADEHITYNDADGDQDVDVTLTVNGTEIHAVTLGDAGACLQYTGTLAAGFHIVKIQPEAGKPTDIRIDKVLIDDHVVVASQYKLDTRIFGKAQDFLKYKACAPFRTPKGSDHVWWGEVWNADYSVISNTTWYRPHVVTDTGQWWEWSFSVTSNGHIHWTVDDSDSILHDSTENHVYYAAKSILTTDSTAFPTCNYSEVDALVDSDSSSPVYGGEGSYDSNLHYQGTAIGEQTGLTTLYNETEWYDAVWFNKIYWPANDIDPIVIT